MPLATLFISGPRHSGKTAVAHVVAQNVVPGPVHYLRLRHAPDSYTNTVIPAEPAQLGLDVEARWASCHLVQYTADRVFETLPEGLRTVRRLQRTGFTIIEADGDATLRHAYPYDYRVFVMSPPRGQQEVFRDPQASADALREVMQDTAAFASEIFGVDLAGLDDTAMGIRTVPARQPLRAENVADVHISDVQLQQFLNSPLGAEIACRIQLQAEYYALVESDVAVINTGVRPNNSSLDLCVKRLEKLLARVRQEARRCSFLYWGDVTDDSDPARQRLIGRLRVLVGA